MGNEDRYRGSRRESAVAQLFSLGDFARMKVKRGSVAAVAIASLNRLHDESSLRLPDDAVPIRTSLLRKVCQMCGDTDGTELRSVLRDLEVAGVISIDGDFASTEQEHCGIIRQPIIAEKI